MKINVAKWKIQVQEKYDLGRFTDDPQGYSIYSSKRLDTVGALRKKYLLSVLEARNVEPSEKYDDWGHLRCNSADTNNNNRNKGKHMKPRRRLKEKELVN